MNENEKIEAGLLAQWQAHELLERGGDLRDRVRHVWVEKRSGVRTLHTLFVDGEEAEKGHPYRRPRLGEVLLGDFQI